MKSSEMSAKEQDEFFDAFYQVADDRLQDQGTSYPWGCAWKWGDNILTGSTIKEMAVNFYYDNEKEILELLDNE